MGRFICRRSVWSHAPLQRRSTVRRSDGYIQVIPNLKTLRLQGHGIICPLPTRHGVPDLLNSVHLPFWVWEYDGEGKMCAFLSGLRINLFHQAGKFFKGGVHPGVNLKLARGHISSCKLVHSVVSSVISRENSQQQRTCKVRILLGGLNRGVVTAHMTIKSLESSIIIIMSSYKDYTDLIVYGSAITLNEKGS